MPPAGGHTLRRRLHPRSPPLRYGGKDSPCKCAPGKVPVSSPPQSRKSLDRLFEGAARAEGGNLLGRDLHFLAGLGIPPLPGLALLDGELPEARDLHLLAGLQRLDDDLLEGREVPLGLGGGHVGLLGDPLDELLLLHGYSLSTADFGFPTALLVLLTFLFIRESGSLTIPLRLADLADRTLLGCAARDALHLVEVYPPSPYQSHRRSGIRVLSGSDPSRYSSSILRAKASASISPCRPSTCLVLRR